MSSCNFMRSFADALTELKSKKSTLKPSTPEVCSCWKKLVRCENVSSSEDVSQSSTFTPTAWEKSTTGCTYGQGLPQFHADQPLSTVLYSKPSRDAHREF